LSKKIENYLPYLGCSKKMSQSFTQFCVFKGSHKNGCPHTKQCVLKDLCCQTLITEQDKVCRFVAVCNSVEKIKEVIAKDLIKNEYEAPILHPQYIAWLNLEDPTRFIFVDNVLSKPKGYLEYFVLFNEGVMSRSPQGNFLVCSANSRCQRLKVRD
jgi:hypothetical protein